MVYVWGCLVCGDVVCVGSGGVWGVWCLWCAGKLCLCGWMWRFGVSSGGDGNGGCNGGVCIVTFMWQAMWMLCGPW